MAKKNCDCAKKERSDRQKLKDIIEYRKSIHFKDESLQRLNEIHVQDLIKSLDKIK